MNNADQNRFNMLVSVQQYLDQSTATWSLVPVITRFKNELDQKVTDINVLEGADEDSSAAARVKKDNLKDTIARKTSILAGALYAYAEEAGDNGLSAKANLSPNTIKKLRDMELPDRITAFITALRPELANLADYGVTEDQVTDLETSLDDYRPLVGKARLIRSNNQITDREVSKLVSDGTSLLSDKLDRVMRQFEISDPGFYDGYLRARVIVDN